MTTEPYPSAVAKIPTRNPIARKKRDTVFQFIITGELGKPVYLDRKTIRSHVVRGKGRPKNAASRRKPRVGAWIKADDGYKDGIEVQACVSNTIPRVYPAATAAELFSEAADISPMMADKTLQAFSSLSDAMFPQNLCLIYDVHDLFWFKFLRDYPKLAETILFMAEASSDSIQGRCLGTKASNLLTKVLRSLQGDLDDPATATRECTICVVVALAMVADIQCDVEGSRKHIRGLQKIVTMRGGIASLETSQLQAKCCRVDIHLAISTGSKPVFFTEDISWGPYFGRESQDEKQTSPTAEAMSTFPYSNIILDSRLQHIWADTRECCDICNLAFFTKRKIEPRLFQEIIISVQYRLLHLKYLNDFNFESRGDSQNRLHEVLRCGILAFTTTIFMKILNMEVRYHLLGLQLRAALVALDKPGGTMEWELRLWLCFVVSITLFRGREHEWLVAALTQSTRALRLTSWLEVKVVLKRHLWIDMIHDAEVFYFESTEKQEKSLVTYRISLPFCPFSSRDGRYTSVLRLDPDHDIVQFGLGLLSDISTSVDFLHDTLAYDPRGLSLANIAVSSAFHLKGLRSLQPSELEDAGRGFRQAVTNLKTVYIWTEIIDQSMPIHIWGFPITAWIPDFHWQGSDRRPINASLSNMTLRGIPPRQVMEAWAQFETKFGIDRSASSRGPLEIMYAAIREHYHYRGPRPDSLEGMAELVQTAEKTRPRMSARKVAQLSQGPVPTAGFWAWPPDAFDHVPAQDEENSTFLADMSGRPIPQLAIFTIP